MTWIISGVVLDDFSGVHKTAASKRVVLADVPLHQRQEREREYIRMFPAPQNWNEGTFLKNLLMPLFLMGCFPVDFQEVKRPLTTKSVKRPIKVGKRPINEGKRPIKAKVLVGVSVGSLMGCFRAPPP